MYEGDWIVGSAAEEPMELCAYRGLFCSSMSCWDLSSCCWRRCCSTGLLEGAHRRSRGAIMVPPLVEECVVSMEVE